LDGLGPRLLGGIALPAVTQRSVRQGSNRGEHLIALASFSDVSIGAGSLQGVPLRTLTNSLFNIRGPNPNDLLRWRRSLRRVPLNSVHLLLRRRQSAEVQVVPESSCVPAELATVDAQPISEGPYVFAARNSTNTALHDIGHTWILLVNPPPLDPVQQIFLETQLRRALGLTDG